MRMTLVTLALSTLLATGCTTLGARVQKGMNLYDRTDFPGALDQFTALSAKERDMNQKGAVRYLVYRGLTHYRLDQRPEAYLFLSRGQEAYSRGTPAWLHPRTVGEMERALAELACDAPSLPPESSEDAPPPPPESPEDAPPPPPPPPAWEIGETTIVIVPQAPAE
jgi:hypothetical protein